MSRSAFFTTPSLLLLAGALAGPAGCTGAITSPDASISAVAPAAVCNAQMTTVVTATGNGFTPLPVGTLTSSPHLELPKVLLALHTLPDGTAGPAQDLAIPDDTQPPGNHVRWESAQGMDFDIYPGLGMAVGQGAANLAPGLYDLSIRNPDGRRATATGSLAVVPPPTLKGFQPVPLCDAQGTVPFTLSGAGFIQLGSALPAISFTPTMGNAQPLTLPAQSGQGCAPLPSPMGTMLAACPTVQGTLPKGALAAGSYRVSARNPGSTGCATQEDVRAVVVPPPAVDMMKTRGEVCTAQGDTTLVLQGSAFLTVTSAGKVQGPQVQIDGQPFTSAASNCQPVVDAPGAQLCTTLSVALPRGSVQAGTHMLTVQDPAPVTCGLSMPFTIVDSPPPTLASVQPGALCGGGGSLVLTGTGLLDGATVTLNGVSAGQVTVSADGKTATAVFAGPLKPGGPYDLVLRNQDSCQASLSGQVNVVPGPSILFVDPPVMPNTASFQVTVYATGVTPAVTGIGLAPSGSTTYTALTFAAVPMHPNRLLATIPANLAAGNYDMRLTDSAAGMCPAILPGALKISDKPTLTVSSLTPAFGSTAQDTAVVVSGAGFVSLPRVYLNPTGNPPGSRASALSAVTYQNSGSLSGVVPAGLSAGGYDVLVVNPDGSFGVATKAYTETPANAPPPVITSVGPASFVTGAATPATIYGNNFRTPTVTLACQDAGGAAVMGGSATLSSSTATTIKASITTAGVLCIVRVTNQDGTYFDYSGIGVTGASLNLNGFKAGASLTTPRRALGASAGRPTFVARFVYAAGGDNGNDNAPLASVEAAPTALDGTLGTFAVLSQKLPAARSFLGLANIGRFLFAVGGFDGAAAVKDVYRAELLSPLLAPQVSDIDVKFDDTGGLGPGLYIYRVSAVLDATDPSNPGGETLASDPFPVQLPTIASGKVDLTLSWTPVPHAAQYRVYRSPKADAVSGQEVLLGTVAATATPLVLTDDGTKMPAGAAPLPLGSTGTWMPVAKLNTARLGAGVSAVPSPGTAGLWLLYAAGGNSGSVAAPAPLSSVEFLPVTVDPVTGNQTLGAWTTTSALATARWVAPAVAATPTTNTIIPAGSAYLYVLGGATSSLTTASTTVEVASIGSDGKLGAFTSLGGPDVKRSAIGGMVVDDQVMAFGGFQAGAATNNSDSAKLSSPTMAGKFNALGGGALSMPRALQGTALESAFIYQIGGASAGPNTAQASTEQSVW